MFERGFGGTMVIFQHGLQALEILVSFCVESSMPLNVLKLLPRLLLICL